MLTYKFDERPSVQDIINMFEHLNDGIPTHEWLLKKIKIKYEKLEVPIAYVE